ncbi:tyrosine-type recombinase/integrase [Hydrogenothermus marinus]|uniref:Integrase/recombinase XerC/integrase/recombinase XerD n=1 Tax=Hydrogenothermus marinus TaxID=133270 RepID=A0A3M0CAL6_9AQUI|nr:site-specific integrase [Hydrogenothermus marinus]RMB00063.1 integrase/recombinase XerC/integrase/recombinase XerD [Hydrogenothermus marinus]
MYDEISFKVNFYLNKLKKRGLSDKSIDTYKNLLKHFEDWFDEYGLISEDNLILVETDIEKFIQYLKSKNLSPTTIKMILNRTKEFIEFSGGKWLADKRIYRERNKTESAKPYSEIELKQILNYLKATNKIYYQLALTLYGFGLRISEATNLLPDDIIEKENQIFVRVRSEISKFNKSREAPLILKDKYREDFIEFIVKRKNPKLKDKTLFTYYNDIQKRIVVIDRHNVKSYFHKISKELGINITAHRFRDTYISYMVAKGIKPLTVAKWVGHKDITTTLKYYTKLTTKDELEELQKI